MKPPFHIQRSAADFGGRLTAAAAGSWERRKRKREIDWPASGFAIKVCIQYIKYVCVDGQTKILKLLLARVVCILLASTMHI